MANALAQETSPYLRQHAENPVDWLPWGPDAFARARALDRPLLVSIGYSACHWCHVMERESFTDARIAALMNECFVCVKVDREERPDIDAIYMEAVQGMTGHGGWPLNVFITPEQLPFYGGTYFPPEPRHGMPSFSQVLQAVAAAWSERKDEIRAGNERLREQLSGAALLRPASAPPDPSALREAEASIDALYDPLSAGFGGAPKFPHASVIEFLLGRAAHGCAPAASRGAVAAGAAQSGGPQLGRGAQMALATLRSMAHGGIHDAVGGGFHRYAVDATWTVPHFEKMLYDNALLAKAYLHGFQLSRDPELLEVCLGTLEWALREMRAPEGGFYASLDADSEGVEGRFYVWTAAELRAALGSDFDPAERWLSVSEQGNFVDPHHPEPGLNVLQATGPRPDQATVERIRQALLHARAQRARPALDHKRLCSWNALMISALSCAGAHLTRSGQLALDDRSQASELGARLLDAASACAEFVLGELRDPAGRLLRTYSDGQARLDAYLEDHAFMLEAMLDLYEASFQESWFMNARELADVMIARFADPEHGGFFSTASDHEALIARRKDLEDSPIPSGSSSAALGLLRLAALTGESSYERHGSSVLSLVHQIAPRHPLAFGHLLQALHFHLCPVRELALVGEPGPELDALLAVVAERLRPGLVLAAGSAHAQSAVPLLEGRSQIEEGHATAYVCERFACLRPVSSAAELAALLNGTEHQASPAG